MAVDPICYNHVHTRAVTERTSALLKCCWMCLDRSRRIRLYCTAQSFFLFTIVAPVETLLKSVPFLLLSLRLLFSFLEL